MVGSAGWIVGTTGPSDLARDTIEWRYAHELRVDRSKGRAWRCKMGLMSRIIAGQYGRTTLGAAGVMNEGDGSTGAAWRPVMVEALVQHLYIS